MENDNLGRQYKCIDLGLILMIRIAYNHDMDPEIFIINSYKIAQYSWMAVVDQMHATIFFHLFQTKHIPWRERAPYHLWV